MENWGLSLFDPDTLLLDPHELGTSFLIKYFFSSNSKKEEKNILNLIKDSFTFVKHLNTNLLKNFQHL